MRIVQGTNTHFPHLADKLTSLVRKLEMWQQRVKDGNVDSSENLKSFTETTSCRVISCTTSDSKTLAVPLYLLPPFLLSPNGMIPVCLGM